MKALIRTADSKGRVALPGFANTTLIIERVDDTEYRVRRALVTTFSLAASDRAFVAFRVRPATPIHRCAIYRCSDEAKQVFSAALASEWIAFEIEKHVIR